MAPSCPSALKQPGVSTTMPNVVQSMTTTDLLQSDGSVDLGHFRLTPTGLEVRGAPAFPEWEKVGAFLRLAEGAVQWAIGDWWVYGGHRYGERATLAIDPTHGVDRLQRFMNYGWVARAFETSRRREVLSWSHHEAVAALDGADQDRLLDETISADWSVRDLRKAVFRLKREEATRTAGPLPPGRFDVILVDPPWDHGMVVHCLQIEGRHYPVMSQDAVCALRVGDLAADDCVLFLWAVSPMLPEAFSVLTSWGFTYKTNLAWVKDRVGLGWWVRQQHELLL